MKTVIPLPQASQQDFAKSLFAEYIPAIVLELKNLPDSVELTILQSAKENAKLICLVNYQDELPNIPLHDVEVKLRIPDSDRIVSVTSVEDGSSIPFEAESDAIAIKIDRIEGGRRVRRTVKTKGHPLALPPADRLIFSE